MTGYENFKVVPNRERRVREPAPIQCEGTCKRVTIHTFSRTTRLHLNECHDVYKCRDCGQERVWG